MVRELYLRFQQLIHEGAKFGVVGGLGVLITLGGTDLLLVAYPHMDPVVASTIATFVAIAFTYLGSRYWTFRHRERTGMGRETALFFVLAGIGWLIQEACVVFVHHVLGETGKIPVTVALFIGIVLGTLFRFWSYRKWVWAAPQPAPAEAVLGGQELDHPVMMAQPGASQKPGATLQSGNTAQSGAAMSASPRHARGSLEDEVGRSR